MSEAPRCSFCDTAEGVQLAALAVDGSAAKMYHGCGAHAPEMVRAVDDMLDNLAWLQRTRTSRLESRRLD
jgi:hypothetical protein